MHTLLILFVLLWAVCAEAAVTIDAITVSGSTNDFGLDTFSHTVAADANALLLCTSTTGATSGDETIASATYNADALTALVNAEPGGGADTRTELWYRLAPDIGTHDMVVTPTADPWFINVAISLKQVAQVPPTHTQIATGASSTPNLTLTSAAGELVLDCLTVHPSGAAVSDPSEGPGQTQQWFTQHDTSILATGSTMAGAASVTPDWTLDDVYLWAQVAVSLAEAAVTSARRQSLVVME